MLILITLIRCNSGADPLFVFQDLTSVPVAGMEPKLQNTPTAVVEEECYEDNDPDVAASID